MRIPFLRRRPHVDFGSITAAFPARLRADAATVAAAMPPSRAEFHGPFAVTLGGEIMRIPERIYNAEPTRVAELPEAQQLILHCIYSRHHDGFVRHRHLDAILGSSDEWAAPFVLRLVGEYVLPIVQDIERAIAANSAERTRLRRVAADDPAFLELTRQRAVSYWNAYYRSEYPNQADYPAIAALAALRTLEHPLL